MVELDWHTLQNDKPLRLSALVSIGNPLLYRRRRHHEFLRCLFDEIAVLKFLAMPREARIEGTATRTYDKHNSGHDDDEHNSRHSSGHNGGRNDGGNGHRRAYEAWAGQARQRDTSGQPLSLQYPNNQV